MNLIIIAIVIIWAIVLVIRIRKNRQEISIYNLMYKNQTRDIGKEIARTYRGGYQPKSDKPLLTPPPQGGSGVRYDGPTFEPDMISESYSEFDLDEYFKNM